MDKYLWEHVQIFLDRGDLLRLKEKLPSSTQRASDLVATGPHSAPTMLGPGRVLILSCAAFDTNTTLAVERTLVVELDQEWPPNQIMYVLIDTRAGF